MTQPWHLEEVMEFLTTATTVRERAAAIAAVLPEVEPWLARTLRKCAHLVVRGGGTTLLREMWSAPLGSPEREVANRWVARNGARGVIFTRTATTRGAPAHDSRVLTLETGGSAVGHVAFSPDGTRVVAFVSAGCPWDAAIHERNASWLGQWDASTGELLDVVAAGQFREGDGTFALNEAMTAVAVRSHRSTHVHEIDDSARTAPQIAQRLRGSEGPRSLAFVNDGALVANDGYDLIRFDVRLGAELGRASSIGSAFVVSQRLGKVLVGGGLAAPTSVAVHELPSLAIEGTVRSDARGVAKGSGAVCALALSPSERWLATASTNRATGRVNIQLWNVDDLMSNTRDPAFGSPPGELRSLQTMPVREVGEHLGWTCELAFVDDTRVLSAGSDGSLIEWDLLAPTEKRERRGHHGYVTAVAVAAAAERRAARAATSASDGNIVIWDLAPDPAEMGTGGAPAAAPFPMRYGEHPLPIALEVTAEHVRVAVGNVEMVLDTRGTVLRCGPSELPPGYRGELGRFMAIAGFESKDIVL